MFIKYLICFRVLGLVLKVLVPRFSSIAQPESIIIVDQFAKSPKVGGHMRHNNLSYKIAFVSESREECEAKQAELRQELMAKIKAHQEKQPTTTTPVNTSRKSSRKRKVVTFSDGQAPGGSKKKTVPSTDDVDLNKEDQIDNTLGADGEEPGKSKEPVIKIPRRDPGKNHVKLFLEFFKEYYESDLERLKARILSESTGVLGLEESVQNAIVKLFNVKEVSVDV